MDSVKVMETEFYENDENSNPQKDKIQHGNNKKVLLQKRWTRRNINVLCAIFGITFLFTGITIFLSFHTILEHFIKKYIVITPDSFIVDYWRETPLPVYSKVYFFNITNEEDYPWDIVKPRLQEVGPYTYREHMVKVDLEWNDNDTVSYKQIRSYTFEPEMSVGFQDDVIFTANVPHVTASVKTKSNAFLKFAMKAALRLLKSSFVVKRRVQQLLFDGYKDIFIKSAQVMGHLPFSKFGYLFDKNGTRDGQYTVHTGVGDSSKLIAIDHWTGRSSFSQRPEHSCKLVYGTDGSWFSPFHPKSSQLHIFSSDVCRSFDLEYSGPAEIYELETYRFKFTNNTFSSCNLFEEGYSCEEKICFTSGVHNMSQCAFGAPVFATFPHFYKADPWLSDNFDGLQPYNHRHESYIDIDPIIGVPANASIKMQLNLLLNKSYSDSLNEMLFPLLWIEKRFEIDEHIAGMLLKVSKKSFYYSGIISFIMIAVGIVFIVIAVYRIIRRAGLWKRKEKFPVILLSCK